MKLKLFCIFCVLLSNICVRANECDDWFRSLKVDPNDPDCEMKCALGGVDLGNFNCPIGCPRHCKKPKK